MRILYIITSLITVMAISTDLQGSVDQRHGWWKIRLKTLQREKRSLQRNITTDPVLLQCIENDIARAEKLLSFFSSGSEDSLPGVSWKAGSDAVRADTRNITDAVFSLRYLEYLTSSVGDMKNHAEVRSVIEQSLSKMLEKELELKDGFFVKSIADEDISNSEWKYIIMESSLNAMLVHRTRLFNEVCSLVEKDVQTAMETPSRGFSQAEFHALIAEKAIARCTSLDLAGRITVDDESLKRSGTWKTVTLRITDGLHRLKEIRDMMDDRGKDLTAAQVRYYYHNPSEMEGVIFKSASVRYFDRRLIGQTSFDRSRPEGDTYSMNIPKNPDGLMMFRDLDELRIKTISGLNGRENSAFFNDLRSRFDAILDRHLRETIEGFRRDEETVRGLKEKNPDITILNEDTFLKAQAIFNGRADLVRGYVHKSIFFIKKIAESKKMDGDAIVQAYTEKLDMNREFLGMVLSLVDGAADSARIDLPEVHRNFALAMRRTGNIFKTLGYGLSIDSAQASFLSGSNLVSVRNAKAGFIDEMKRTRLEISRHYEMYVQKRSSLRNSRFGEERSLQAKIAALEVESITESLKGAIDALERLHYGRDAFNEYASVFNGLHEELTRGILSAKLERALGMKSLVPLVEEFDARRIVSESSTRGYLRKHIATEIARLVTLINYYKQRNIELKNAPSADFLRKARSAINSRPVTAIASWTMTEHNFRMIDHNAVSMLAQMKNRITWDAGKTADTPDLKKAELKIPVPGAVAIMSIPAGWNRLAVRDPSHPGLATLRSQDRDASIHIDGNTVRGRTVQQICLDRARSGGGLVIKQRWGKKDDRDYFWALCRLPKNRIMELYVIRNEQYFLVFTGITERTKYRFFKQKLDTVFNSLSFGNTEGAEQRRLSHQN